MGTDITWVGEGVEEYGHVKGDPENVLVRVDPRYFRPTEVELLLVRVEPVRILLVETGVVVLYFVVDYRGSGDNSASFWLAPWSQTRYILSYSQ